MENKTSHHTICQLYADTLCISITHNKRCCKPVTELDDPQ